MEILFTSALKMVRAAFGDMDLLSAGITDCNKHTIDIHCPRFNESPTNISLLSLNFSHISVAFHLYMGIKKIISETSHQAQKETQQQLNYIPF